MYLFGNLSLGDSLSGKLYRSKISTMANLGLMHPIRPILHDSGAYISTEFEQTQWLVANECIRIVI